MAVWAGVDRDAIGAAWTARMCSVPGAIDWFGEIACVGEWFAPVTGS
jgi:hypothetical protein